MLVYATKTFPTEGIFFFFQRTLGKTNATCLQTEMAQAAIVQLKIQGR